MTDSTHSPTSDRALTLRAELKEWERAYAAANNGNKASREEIKRNVEIAAKYKEYNRLKDIQSGKLDPTKINQLDTRKRKIHNDEESKAMQGITTPSKKKQKVAPKFSTPRRAEKKAAQAGQIEILEEEVTAEDFDTPVPRRLFVGPTPQKDGRVLGLFDLLSPAKSDHATSKKVQIDTPSKKRTALESIAVNKGQSALAASGKSQITSVTPQKRKLGREEQDEDESCDTTYLHRHSRTPQSAGRRFLLSTFVTTPSKRNHDGSPKKNSQDTPSSARIGSLAGLSTPAFLRRESQSQDDSIYTSPSSMRWLAQPRRLGFLGKTSRVRSLSTMIADLRRAEDDKLDKEMELLHEMEEESSVGRAQERPAIQTDREQQPHVLASILEEDEDLQDLEGQLGPDGAFEEEAARAAMNAHDEANQQGARPWKKKGLKRQTKRVLLRPQTHGKAAPADTQDNPVLCGIICDVGTAQEDRLETNGNIENGELALQRGEGDEEYDDERNDGNYNQDTNNRTHKRQKTSASTSSEKEGVIKKTARKISATAHANFRRLKIKSKVGKGGKFGRGRR